ncbi:MAG: hypothetical protein HOV94_27895 [Saccharothrix sp.]|nr:hypothetical protein [Saccharothrix sp.]
MTLPALVAAVVAVLLPAGQANAESPAVVVDHGGTDSAIMPGSGSAVVRVSLSAPPPTATSLTVAWAAGTSPVFVSARRTLTFTSTDWDVPQPVRIISLSGFGPGAFTVTGPGVTAGVIRVYSSTMPLPPNLNRSCSVTGTVTASWPGGYTATATVTNTGPGPVADWTVSALFDGDEQVVAGGSADWGQYGRGAAFPSPVWQRTLPPGASATLGFHVRFTHRSTGLWLRCTPEPYLLPTTTTVGSA